MPKDNKPKLTIPKVLLRGILYTIVIPVVAIMVIVGGLYLKSSFELNSTQADMKGYLQNKYGQEFVVERPERKGAGLGVEGHLDAIAYPKNDETVRFIVMSSSTGIRDGYAGAVWTKSEKERMEPVVREIFGDRVRVSIDIKTFGTFRGDVPVLGLVPSFKEGAEKYGASILYMLYIEDRDPLRGNESEASAKVFRLLPSINSHTDLIFSYRSQEGNGSYGISLNQDKIKSIKNINDLNIMYKDW